MISQKSIAVLPFISMSADIENQYFADGISEEIINALSKIKGLKVTSRTSSFAYRDNALDVRLIGNELGVSTILEGSVRNQGERVRISTQLIRTDTGFQIWSERFDRELSDIFALQDEISRLIAERIRENFGHLVIEDELVKSHTQDSRAYNSYLQGRYYQLQWNQEGLQKALNVYKKSIAFDPTYPMPYLGICQCFVMLATWNFTDRIKGLFMAHYFLSKLGNEHENISEYHYTKGIFHFLGKWELDKAEQYFKKTLELNPNDSDAMQAQASLYNATGNFKEAHKVINRALVLNPNSPNHFYTKANTFYLNKEYEPAIQCIDKCPEIEGVWSMLSHLKAICLMLLNEKQAFQELISNFDEKEHLKYKYLWHLYYKTEEEFEIESNITEDNYLPIEIYCSLYEGKQEEAFNCLTKGIENKKGSYINFLNDPLLEPLKEHAKYQILSQNTFPKIEIEVKGIEVKTSVNPLLSDLELELFESKLNEVMDKDRFYLNPEITLRELASIIDLHPNKLSWLLNDRIGMNFNDYINSFRLNEFQEKALNPLNKNLTLLGLAFESGFNSKSTFNDFFKKKTGKTPRQWLKEQN